MGISILVTPSPIVYNVSSYNSDIYVFHSFVRRRHNVSQIALLKPITQTKHY